MRASDKPPNERWSLPDLSALTSFDERLREVAADPTAVEVAVNRAASALTTCRTEGNEPGTIWLLGYIGNAYRLLGQADQSIASLRECLKIAIATGDKRAAAVARIRLGESLRCNDQLGESEAVLCEALREIEATEQPDLRDFALQHLGKCLVDQGRLDEGDECLGEALRLRVKKSDATLIASTEAALRLSSSRR